MSSIMEKAFGLFLLIFVVSIWFLILPVANQAICTTTGCGFENISASIKPYFQPTMQIVLALFTVILLLSGLFFIIKGD